MGTTRFSILTGGNGSIKTLGGVKVSVIIDVVRGIAPAICYSSVKKF